jgi:hypothetical protein
MLVRNPSIVILSLDGPMGLVGAPGSLVNHNPDQSHFRLHSNWTAISGFAVPVQFSGFWIDSRQHRREVERIQYLRCTYH